LKKGGLGRGRETGEQRAETRETERQPEKGSKGRRGRNSKPDSCEARRLRKASKMRQTEAARRQLNVEGNTNSEDAKDGGKGKSHHQRGG